MVACLAGCAAGARAEEALRVFAAASLTEVAEQLASGFEGREVALTVGGSSALARQIRDGAPADVFLSASPAWMGFLQEAGALAGEPVVLARNRLVCVAAPDGPLARDAPPDARALLERLGPEGRVAIADEGVPAGEYARSALHQLELLDAFAPLLVGQKDVRAVLYAVERGGLDAGFTYASDARVGTVVVLFRFDPMTHPPIEYQGAVLRDAPHPGLARRFLDHLRGPQARARLADAGFRLPYP